MHGVNQPDTVSENSAQTVIAARHREVTAAEIVSGIRRGDRSALSRGITTIESSNPLHFSKAGEIISGCLPYSGNALRIGITGIPGVGKSTFIETFGKFLTSLGKKVAVLAVDPSSSISHGSILGDKTRMEELVKDPNAFIRPSPSGETLGGVASKTRETITLCEAAGFDVVLIETVGVGQSETAVQGMTDFFLLLAIAGAGDELQGIKRGIMEMADMVVINKADGSNITKAKLAKTEFNRALHFFPAKESGWTAKATCCSALNGDGIEEIWKNIGDYQSLAVNSGYFAKRRSEQDFYWLSETIAHQLKSHFYEDPDVIAKLAEMKARLSRNEISPVVAAKLLLEGYFAKG